MTFTGLITNISCPFILILNIFSILFCGGWRCTRLISQVLLMWSRVWAEKGRRLKWDLSLTCLCLPLARVKQYVCMPYLLPENKQKKTAIRTWRAQTYIRSGSIMPLPWPFWGQQIYLAWIVDVSDNWLFPWIRSHWLWPALAVDIGDMAVV